jgi:hypothetical protein
MAECGEPDDLAEPDEGRVAKQLEEYKRVPVDPRRRLVLELELEYGHLLQRGEQGDELEYTAAKLDRAREDLERARGREKALTFADAYRDAVALTLAHLRGDQEACWEIERAYREAASFRSLAIGLLALVGHVGQELAFDADEFRGRLEQLALDLASGDGTDPA